MTDPDLVAFLQQLGCLDAAPVERGAVGRTEVFDIPQATNILKTSVVTGGEVVVNSEVAFTASGEVGMEGMAPVSGLDDQGPGVRRLGEGMAGLSGAGGHGGRPGLLLLLGDVFPRRERGGEGSTVGFVSSLCEAFERAGHISMMPERAAQR